MADEFDILGSETYTPQEKDISVTGARKLLNMIFIVDVSGSMEYDKKIDAVNEAFTQMIPLLRQQQIDCQSAFEMKIAILAFSNTAEWIVPLMPIMEYNHNEIICTKWQTYYCQAFQELQKKLTRKEYMAHVGKIAEPYIMFMTDGIPMDNYGPALDALLGNGWFQNSQRFAVLIGKDAINSPAARAAVERFASDPQKGVINAVDAAELAREVQAKTIHTIQVATQHAVAGVQTEETEGGDNGGTGGFDQLNDVSWDDIDILDDGDFI